VQCACIQGTYIFDDPGLELDEPPVIQVQGRLALVQAKVKPAAMYGDRRNYLPGEQKTPDDICLTLNKRVSGWQESIFLERYRLP
jgi:hypothetical protein